MAIRADLTQNNQSIPASTLAAMLAALETQGWFVSDDFLPQALTARLRHEAELRWQQGEFHDARIGRKQHLALAADIRGDSILWLDAEEQYPATQEIFQLTGLMQEAFNRYFFLGLKHVELHFARYASGTGYKRHLDQHCETAFRKITIVMYLNPEWSQEDGGELVIYDPINPQEELQRVLPEAGRTVIFRSELLEHEVLPSKRPRWSVTGWFRDDASFMGIAA